MLALTDMTPNLMIGTLLLFVATLYVLFLSRRARGGSISARWVPWVSLAAGPFTGMLYWLAEIYVLNPTRYPLPSDSSSLLVAGLFIGTFSGCIAALAFGIALYLRQCLGK